MNKYNLNKLVKVGVHDFYPSARYHCKKELRFLGVVLRKEGIYDTLRDEYLGFTAPEFHALKDDGIIYEKPEVVLYYQSDFCKTYIFNTINEAKAFADEITSSGRWIS
jgi:hypothetical protein